MPLLDAYGRPATYDTPSFEGVSVRKPSGWIQVSDGDGPNREFDTIQCGHCGRHWVPVPGSGHTRGFCMKCNRITCGGKRCTEICTPYGEEDYKYS